MLAGLRRRGDARASSSASAARSCVRVGGEQRWIAADDAGLYRDALGVVPPGGLPEAFLEDVARRAGAARAPLRADARAVHDRRAARALRRRPVAPCCASSRLPASSCAASCGPAAPSASGATPRCCGACAARRSRRCARRSSRPTSARFARFLPSWQGVDRHPPRRRRESTGCARCSCRSRASRCPPRCGSATCCRAASAPTRRRGWTSSAPRGEVVWVGAGALGRRSGRVALYFREDVDAARPAAAVKGEPPAEPAHEPSASGCGAGACFFTDLLADVDARARGAPGGAVGPRVGGRGRPTTRSRRCARRGSRSPAPQRERARARGGAPLLARGAPARRRRSRAAGR